MAFLVKLPPCVLFEDEHLLVVEKPAGLNTHSPSPTAGEGLYEWLKNREPRWANLAIIHRLDKVTSGVMVFGKTGLANRSLTEQFTERLVEKRYRFLTTKIPSKKQFTVCSKLGRQGEKYGVSAAGELAETEFTYLGRHGEFHSFEAKPRTGRTHQIRAHAEEAGIPILGDALYGGEKFGRVCLHARELGFKHPATGEGVRFVAEPDFERPQWRALRETLIEGELTDAYRVIHGAADGWPGLYIERWGEYLLCETERALGEAEKSFVREVFESSGCRGAFHKMLDRQVRKSDLESASPKLLFGAEPPEWFEARENGVGYQISFRQGYSVGLFLDQRENRRRLLTGHVGAGFGLWGGKLAGKEVLNTFAYTCGFSVCAGLAGARTTSLDLSKKYLDWGRRNFELNGMNPAEHDFIYGDVFDWIRRLGKKGRKFDLIIVDPPTFSQNKVSGIFRAEKDFQKLVNETAALLKPAGVLFLSTNAARLDADDFLRESRETISAHGKIERSLYSPQPFDFPITREEAGYLKTGWFQLRLALT